MCDAQAKPIQSKKKRKNDQGMYISSIRQWAPRAVAAALALHGVGSAQADSFGEVVSWTGAPIHMALTPDGNVLTFGSTQDGAQGGYEMTVWNPRLGIGPAARVVVPNRLDFNSFCTAIIIDPARGVLQVAGAGTDAAPAATGVAEWNSADRTFAPGFRLKYPRYYASSTVLPDGRIHMVGGSLYHGNQLNSSPISEMFTPGRGWTELPGTAKGPQRRADGVQTANPMWYPHVFPVRGSEVFIIAGKYQYFENYSGQGSIRNEQPFVGSNYGASSGALMFRPGQIMQIGGGSPYNNYPGLGSKVATIFDLRGADAQGRTTATRRDTFMRYGRHWATPVMLPNGEVLVVGGSSGNNTLEGVANEVEIFNPEANQWRTGAAMSVPRLYHSSAMLMKDGRVLVGGGGAPGPIFGNSVQVYTPDYLAQSGGVRPSILTGPKRVALGQNFRITADRAITRMTLVKVGSVTHGYHTDQRFFEAAFRAEAGGYSVTFPNDRINATPGLYMVFAFDARGVPSEGKFVRLPSPTGDSGWDAPVDTPTSGKAPLEEAASIRWEACAGEGGTCTVPSTRRVRFGANGRYASREITGAAACNVATFGWDPAAGVGKSCQFEVATLQPDRGLALEPSNLPGYKVRHINFQGYVNKFGSANSDSEWGTSRWIARRGLADGACYSFESADWPGRYLRHQSFALRMDLPDGSAAFNGDATFCPRAPLNGRATGGAVSLESKNYPGYFLRHANFVMGIAPNDGTALFSGDATFLPVNPNKAMNAGNTVNLEPSTQPGYRVLHANFLGYIGAVNATSAPAVQNQTAWQVRPGLGNPACLSLESSDWPGHYLRHQNLRVVMNARDNSALFDQDATFCPRPPTDGRLGGQALSLESLNLPGSFLQHRNYELFVGRNDGSEFFKATTTFTPSVR